MPFLRSIFLDWSQIFKKETYHFFLCLRLFEFISIYVYIYQLSYIPNHPPISLILALPAFSKYYPHHLANCYILSAPTPPLLSNLENQGFIYEAGKFALLTSTPALGHPAPTIIFCIRESLNSLSLPRFFRMEKYSVFHTLNVIPQLFPTPSAIVIPWG